MATEPRQPIRTGVRRKKWKIRRLHRAGYTLEECAKRAGVTYRMAQFWAGGKRSPRLDAAYKELTASGRPDGGGRERRGPRATPSSGSSRQTHEGGEVFRGAAAGRGAA
jgi:hypothetical protein